MNTEEKFDGWYIPGRAGSKNRPEIRISKNYISISDFCIKEYFKNRDHARIGFDGENNKLIIMPIDKDDKYGLKLINNEESNYAYLNAKNFIEYNKLKPKSGKRSERFDCKWDKNKNWIIVENVKKEKEEGYD